MLGYVPDMVFTSEKYGDAYAKFMDSKHVLVDQKRETVPISASQIRKDPFRYWEYLEPCAKAYFAKRFCVVGAESSGTTTMARTLAEHYSTVWVPEFGREYTEAKIRAGEGNQWSTEDFIYIANCQNKLEDQFARNCNKIIICDTDSFATSLWHERYMGYISKEVDMISHGRQYDMYFLTNIDIPFVQDGLRDGEHIRETMHNRFLQELEKRNKPYRLLSGDFQSRLSEAIGVCDSILRQIKSL